MSARRFLRGLTAGLVGLSLLATGADAQRTQRSGPFSVFQGSGATPSAAVKTPAVNATTITGTVPAGATATLKRNGTVQGPATVTSSGVASYTLGSPTVTGDTFSFPWTLTGESPVVTVPSPPAGTLTPWTAANVSASTPLKAYFVRQANATYLDTSGNGHTLTGPDANGQYNTEAGWSVPAPFTVAILYTNAAAPTAYQVVFQGSVAGSGNRALLFERYNNGVPTLGDGTGLIAGSGNVSPSKSAQHVLTATFNGTNSLGSLDGVQTTGLNGGTNGIVNGFRAGGSDGGSYFNGTQQAIAVFAGALSADDQLRVEGSLRCAGSGVTFGLAHAYASACPYVGVATPAVKGQTVAQIAPGSNVARLGTYSGYGAQNPDGTSAIPPTPALFGKPVQATKVFSSNSAQAWSGSTANGETVESSVLYALSLLKGRGLQINLTIALATGSGPYYQFPGMALTDVVAGSADTMFRNVANSLIANGFADDAANPLLLSYPQEQNGPSFPWASDGSAAWNANFIAASKREHDIMAPIFAAAGKTVKWVEAWNKDKPGLPWRNLPANYIGDAYVDMLGWDAYDDDYNYNLPQGYTGATGGNTAQTPAQRWQTSVLGLADGSTGYGLAWLDLFARTPNLRGAGFIDGKVLPIVLTEWAAGGPTSIADTDTSRSLALRQAYAGNDDGYYVGQMLQWFKDHLVYAHFFYDIFDTSIGYTGAVKWTPQNTGMAAAGYPSTTANAIGTGAKTYTVASGLPFASGMPVIVRDDAAPSANYIEAVVRSYSGTTLTLSGFGSSGSGTPASVKILTHPNAVMPNSYAAIKAAQ